jgi:dihydroflavonol-4-reductase
LARKIFVTGGTGFLGAYIITELVLKGYSVRALRRSQQLPFFISKETAEKVEWVTGDILDTLSLVEAMEGMDIVIHAAAKVSFQEKERKDLFRTNIDGTANVVNIMLEKNVHRLVYISSVAAIGRTSNGETVSESTKWQEGKINTHYAISKYNAEMEVWRGMGEGLDVVVLNPTTIIGYGDWNTSSCAIFKNVYREFPWYTTGINGFVSVEDVAKAAVMLMESNYSGERFIVNGDNWSFRQLLDTIADSFDRKRPPKHATPLLGEIAWRIEKMKGWFSGKKPLLTSQTALIAQSKTHFTSDKLLNALPHFSFTPLQQAIDLSCKKYLLNLQPL